MLSIFQKFGCTIASEFIDEFIASVNDLVRIKSDLLLNSLVGRTANKYFKSKKT